MEPFVKLKWIMWGTAVFLILTACNAETAVSTPTQPAAVEAESTLIEEVEIEESGAEPAAVEAETSPAVEETEELEPTNTPQSTPAPLPTRPNSSLTTTASGLQYELLEAGDGEMPQPGDVVAVHYIGTLEDGTVFDNSIERGQPIEFTFGSGNVIAGWEEGIGLMRVGDKMRLIIPPALAYGSAGAGGSIPSNATLTFEVELIEIVPPPATPTPLEPPTPVDEADYIETEEGIRFAILQEGDGEQPQIGDSVTFHFSGWLEADGTSIGSSYQNGQPLDIIIGREEILPGWDLVLPQMKVGEITQFIIPPAWGLGEAGSLPIIPPNSILIFEIELLQINEPPPTPQAINADELITTDTGLQYIILEVGDGELPEAGQTVVLNYRGWLEDGFQFDNSYDRGQPFEFQLGVGQVILGWDEGVALLHVGDKAQFIIPSELGYGANGTRNIPPGATLIFEVELIDIR